MGQKIKILLVRIANCVGKKVLVTSFQRSTANAWITRVANDWNKRDKEINALPDGEEKKRASARKRIYRSTYDGVVKVVNWDQFWGNVYEGGEMKRKKKSTFDCDQVFAVIIDEFFQMPRRCLKDLCELFINNQEVIFVPIGDYNQIPAIDNVTYNWMERDLMTTFVTHKLKKNYIQGCGRFSKKVLKILRWLENRDFKSFINWVKKYKSVLTCDDLNATKYHICRARKEKYKNSVESINKKICPKIKKGHEVICENVFSVDRVNEKNKKVDGEKTEILVGEKYPVLKCKKNFCLLKVNDCGVDKYGWFPIKYKKQTGTSQKILSPAYASTAFREQGREICETYTIHGAHNMTVQELIVSISRGKTNKTGSEGILFRFSCIDQLIQRHPRSWEQADSYIVESVPLPMPGCMSGYTKSTVEQPGICPFSKYLLYDITDDNGGRYIGQHKWDEGLDLEQNLNNRMKGHLNKDVPKNKKSPVLKMKNPVIKPFYGNINDDEENTYFMYGTYSQILRVEEMHIRKVMVECKKNEKQYFNRAGTKEKQEVDEKKVKEVVVKDNEIQTFINRFAITTKKRKDKKNQKEDYIIVGKSIADVLGHKSDKFKSVNIQKILDQKMTGIAKLCLCEKEYVEKIYKQMIKDTGKEYI